MATRPITKHKASTYESNIFRSVPQRFGAYFFGLTFCIVLVDDPMVCCAVGIGFDVYIPVTESF